MVLVYVIILLFNQGRIQGAHFYCLTRGGSRGRTRRPPKIGKNKKKLRKVILHTKYPKNVRASLRSALLF